MNDEIPVGRLVSVIVGVLAAALLISIAGLVILGALKGDTNVALTLTHVIETLLGVFVGIAAGRLASDA
jgi:hypothetical protein